MTWDLVIKLAALGGVLIPVAGMAGFMISTINRTIRFFTNMEILLRKIEVTHREVVDKLEALIRLTRNEKGRSASV